MRRRIYLMRHGAVAYFDGSGHPVPPDTVPLTEEGRAQAEAARDLLEGIALDRVIASGLPRTMVPRRSSPPVTLSRSGRSCRRSAASGSRPSRQKSSRTLS